MTYTPHAANAAIAEQMDNPEMRCVHGKNRRFLTDVIRLSRHDLSKYESPVLMALLIAIRDMTGASREKVPHMIQPGLVYYMAHIAYSDWSIPDYDSPGSDRALSIAQLSECLEATVAQAIRDDKVTLQFEDGEVYLDFFQIPRWFYEQERNAT